MTRLISLLVLCTLIVFLTISITSASVEIYTETESDTLTTASTSYHEENLTDPITQKAYSKGLLAKGKSTTASAFVQDGVQFENTVESSEDTIFSEGYMKNQIKGMGKEKVPSGSLCDNGKTEITSESTTLGTGMIAKNVSLHTSGSMVDNGIKYEVQNSGDGLISSHSRSLKQTGTNKGVNSTKSNTESTTLIGKYKLSKTYTDQ